MHCQVGDPPPLIVKHGTYKNGSNFLPHQVGRSGDIIISQKMEIVLDIFDAQRHSDANTKGTMVVDVQRIGKNNSFWFDKGSDDNCWRSRISNVGR